MHSVTDFFMDYNCTHPSKSLQYLNSLLAKLRVEQKTEKTSQKYPRLSIAHFIHKWLQPACKFPLEPASFRKAQSSIKKKSHSSAFFSFLHLNFLLMLNISSTEWKDVSMYEALWHTQKKRQALSIFLLRLPFTHFRSMLLLSFILYSACSSLVDFFSSMLNISHIFIRLRARRSEKAKEEYV